MAPRKDDEDLLAQLDSLGVDEQPQAQKTGAKSTTKAKSKTSNGEKKPAQQEEEDPLADLQAQLAPRPNASRPSTPRLSSSTNSAAKSHTPASSGQGSARNSEDRLSGHPAAAGTGSQARKSGESARGYHEGVTPAAEEKEKPEFSKSAAEAEATPPAVPQSSGGGWWGSFASVATAARKQAENIAKDIRSNEEAQRWASQLQSNLNIHNLQSLSDDLRSRALPTFTNIISHIAPPISAHERLQIHTTHDIHGYPSLDPLIYSTFERVMAQVEGGELLVLQRGSESRARSTSEAQGYRGGVLGSSGTGWSDGPWWRDSAPGTAERGLGAVPGLKEGSRLARVSAESYAKDFFDRQGGVEEAAKKATESLNSSNPTRSSDIFLAIQAIQHTADGSLFAADAREGQESKESGGVQDPEEEAEELITFAVYLHDPLHSLSFYSLSQAFPQRWANWLDASPEKGTELPESIREILESGGLDPREWVAEWMEETLQLAVGVVAQKYVARRMGVGEGGLGRGKRRAEEEGIGGEAARVI